MGYLLTTLAPSIQLGIPRPLQTVFILEDALVLLTNQYAVGRARSILVTLNALEEKMKAAQCTLVASKLGSLELHPGKDRGHYYTDLLEREYVRWVNRLADILGAPKYAYAERFRRRGPGTHLRVSG
jgi:hypothetical protein